MKKPLDLTKPVQTRDGKPARILCTDYMGVMPVLAAVTETSSGGSAYEECFHYTPDGSFLGYIAEPHDFDLVNVPEKREMWVNVYPSIYSVCGHPTKEQADIEATHNRVACVKIVYTEGEGL